MLISTVQFKSVTLFILGINGNVFSFNSVMPQLMEEVSWSIRNMTRGPSQTFWESTVWRQESQAKHFPVALPISISKSNCTDPNTKFSLEGFYNFQKTTSGPLAVPSMSMPVWMTFTMLMLKEYLQVSVTKWEMQLESLSLKKLELPTLMQNHGQLTILVHIEFFDIKFIHLLKFFLKTIKYLNLLKNHLITLISTPNSFFRISW